MSTIYSIDHSMDIRRVQVTGGSSFMITLPKAWAESIGLKKNDPVGVSAQPNGSLVLSVGSHKGKDPGMIEIDLDPLRDGMALYRRLIGAYIGGNRQIAVRSEQPIKGGFLEAVSKFTQTSIGMEIVDEDECRIVMKDLMDQTEIQPQKNVRREYLLVKRMISDVFQSAECGDKGRLSGMADRDTEVDRIHWLVQREASMYQSDMTLGARTGTDLRRVTGCVPVSKTIERIGDHAVLMAGHLLSMKDAKEAAEVDRILAEISGEVAGSFDDAVSSWMANDVDKAEECIRRSRSLAHHIETLFGPGGSTDASMIGGSSKRLAEYCGDIAESAIDLSMGEVSGHQS